VPAEPRDAALAAIDAVVGLALTLDGARYATPYAFVRALKRRALAVPAPRASDAVQLLTVHGAKGLEARTVFVVDADPEPRQAESATMLVEWPVDAAAPRTCAFVYSEKFCAPSLERLRDAEMGARRREELNALYVAMTRAEDRLVFSATEPYRRPEPTWWDRIGGLVASDDGDSPALPLPAAVRPILLRELPPLPKQGVPAVATKSRALDDEASRLGQAVHRVLEWARPGHRASPGPRASDHGGTSDRSLDLAALSQAAAHAFGVESAAVLELASRIDASPAVGRFFSGPSLRWSGNEVAVSESGEPLRIDRLVLLDEGEGATWWVLDYKLSHAPEALAEYRAQLLRYRSAVQAAQPEARVRCAFVTGEGHVLEIDAA
jgi:ATP-dependent helicase/nuclease subunit A